MYNNKTQQTQHILFNFIFENCQLSTEETEESEEQRAFEKLNN